MNILDVMNDPEAFAPWFAGPSWDAWRCILRAAYCLPMSPQELVRFDELAGGRSPPRKRVRQLYVVGGRRGGKDSIASLLGVWSATLEEGHRGRLRPGEKALVNCSRSTGIRARSCSATSVHTSRRSPISGR